MSQIQLPFLPIQAKELAGIKLKKGIILIKEMLMKLNEGNVNCPTCRNTVSCCCERCDVKIRVRPPKETQAFQTYFRSSRFYKHSCINAKEENNIQKRIAKLVWECMSERENCITAVLIKA